MRIGFLGAGNMASAILRGMRDMEKGCYDISEAAVRRAEQELGARGFSGGEALLQHAFVEDVCDRLPDVHKAIETSGYASAEVFLSVVERLDLVMMDIKLVDGDMHRRYTGVDNAQILANLRALIRSGKPFRARVPVIPLNKNGKTDRTYFQNRQEV